MFTSTPNHNTNPCSSFLSSTNTNSNYGPANCYRPLQQLYKTVYSPTNGNTSSPMTIECICRPAERYKTTNMTYGSFYYDNSLSTEKNLAINYDKAAFARCYDNNRLKMGYSSKDKNCGKEYGQTTKTPFSQISSSLVVQYFRMPMIQKKVNTGHNPQVTLVVQLIVVIIPSIVRIYKRVHPVLKSPCHLIPLLRQVILRMYTFVVFKLVFEIKIFR